MQASAKKFYITGGTLPRDASSYVERAADALLVEELQSGQFCYVLTSRQMGKSSLMVQAVTRLRQEGAICVVIDLTAIGQNLDAEHWYSGILNRLAQQLGLEDELEEFWFTHPEVSPLLRLMRALREVALRLQSGQIVIFIDEIDAVRSLPFSADEFFAAIRSCYNRRTEDPEFARLTFCLLGVASPSDLIRDTRTTPFNIGSRIDLTDFTLEEARPLAQGMESANSQQLLERILTWTGGHPYLTQRLCQAVAADTTVKNDRDVDRICRETFLSTEARDQNDNLLFVRDRILRSALDVESLLETYRQVAAGQDVPNNEANPVVSELRLAGIVSVHHGSLRPRNRIYAAVFDRAWIRSNMPDDEVRRQRAAYRRGVLRVSAVSACVVLALTGLALYAFQQRNESRASAKQARQIAARERQARADADRNAADRSAALTEANHQRNVADAKTHEAKRALAEAKRQRHIAEEKTSEAKKALALAKDRLVNLNTANAGKDRALKEAQLQRDSAERTAYIARMNTAQRDYGSGNVRHLMEILRQTAHSRFRGFEWGYWNQICHCELLTIKAHADRNRVQFSPDGKLILSSNGFDGTASLWDAQTGREIRIFRGTKEFISCAVFSPDGTHVVTGSADMTATIWEAATGKKILTLRQGSYVQCVAISPDGKRIASGSWDGKVKIWNAQTGAEAATMTANHSTVLCLAFSPDGKRIVSGQLDSAETVWDALTGRPQLTLLGGGTDVACVTFSADGNHIFASGRYGMVTEWDASTGQEQLTVNPVPGRGRSAAFSPDGSRFCVGNEDGEIDVWDIRLGRRVFALTGHVAQVESVAYSPDGTRIVSGCFDGTMKVWDAVTQHDRRSCDNAGGITFVRYRSQVVTPGRNHTVDVWETEGGKRRVSLLGHSAPVESVDFSPDGKRIVTASADHTAILWDARNGSVVHVLKGHSDTVWSAVFSPDGRRIATASQDGTAKVWDAETGSEIVTLRGHSQPVVAVAFSPDGRRIVTGSTGKTAIVWDAHSGSLITRLTGHSSEVWSVAFSPDGSRIATGSWDSTARVWHAQTGKQLYTLAGHTAAVYSVAFSPDGSRIATGSRDGSVKVWETQSGQETLTLTGHTMWVHSVAFSRDGRRLASGATDGSFLVWLTDWKDPSGH